MENMVIGQNLINVLLVVEEEPRRKTRACNNPAPAFGGKTCEGPSVVTQSCNTQHCPGILIEIFKVL